MGVGAGREVCRARYYVLFFSGFGRLALLVPMNRIQFSSFVSESGSTASRLSAYSQQPY